MRYTYYPNGSLEKFGLKVYGALVENFSRTFFVGGLVRNMLLDEKISDIDIATQATPAQVAGIVRQNNILVDGRYSKFGVITVRQGQYSIEITTFRRDLPAPDRYPEVRYVRTPKHDSQRRDFTMNALYFHHKSGEILDFHEGLRDIEKRRVKFIGNAVHRIHEDPLRIIRALRFQVALNFSLEAETRKGIEKYFFMTSRVSKNKILAEILKLKLKRQQMQLKKIINSYPLDAHDTLVL